MTSGRNLELHFCFIAVFFFVVVVIVVCLCVFIIFICTEDAEGSLFPSSLQVYYLNTISQLLVLRLYCS